MDSVSAVLAWLEAEPTVARHASAASKLEKLADPSLPPVRLAILRNFALEPAIAYVKVKCYQAGLHPSVYLGQYDAVEQDVLADDTPLYRFRPDITVLALRLHTLAPALLYRFMELSAEQVRDLCDGILSRVGRLVSALRQRSTALILVHNFELAHSSAQGVLDATGAGSQQNSIRRLNAGLTELLAGQSNAYVLDVEHLLARVGYDAGLDDRFWHIGRSPYAPPAQRALAAEYAKFARALKGKSKKCLVLDCDNTLWGGVVGEEGSGGIALGATYPGSAFVEFQSAVLDLFHRGVLLALCSKNNPADVFEVFDAHPASILKREHFVCAKVNWTDKATNIREISAELNIGLDSLVFLDDSKFECQWVRERVPEVTTVELPPDPTRYRRLLQDLGLFETLSLGDEDRRRSSMYRAETKRRSLKESVGSLEDYLRSLQIELTLGDGDVTNIPRLAQLTQKTNQFNLTTRRYAEADLARMAADPEWSVCYARAKDAFDDNGIVAVALVRHGGRTDHIDTLLMSCRVIGRGVERAVLAFVADRSRARGAERLAAEYIPTTKNALAATFLPDSKFKRAEGEDQWVFDLAEPMERPTWFKSVTVLAAPAATGV